METKSATDKKKQPTKKPDLRPRAIHASTVEGDVHAVGIWNLHVVLSKEEHNFWVAQGLEIDYVAQGDTAAEARNNFETGLEATIDLNLRMYGNIEGLLVFAPNEVLQEAASKGKGSMKIFGQVTMHDIGAKSEQSLPFDYIRYIGSVEEVA